MHHDDDALSALVLHDIDLRHCTSLKCAVAALLATAAMAVTDPATAQTQLGTVVVWGSPISSGGGGLGGSGGANFDTYAPGDLPYQAFDCAGHQRLRPQFCNAPPSLPEGAFWGDTGNYDSLSALGRIFRYLNLQPASSQRATGLLTSALAYHTQGLVLGASNADYGLLFDLSYACVLQAIDDPVLAPIDSTWGPSFGTFRQLNPQVTACYDALNATRQELGLNPPSAWDEFWTGVSDFLSNLFGTPVEVSVDVSANVPSTPVSLNLGAGIVPGSLEHKYRLVGRVMECARWYDAAITNHCPTP
jgi:hypothetical protein